VRLRDRLALWQSLLAGAAMAWQVLWSLVLDFTISGVIQAYVTCLHTINPASQDTLARV
jgi:hypothetical protein